MPQPHPAPPPGGVAATPASAPAHQRPAPGHALQPGQHTGRGPISHRHHRPRVGEHEPTRPAGYPGSTGRYAAPAFHTPSNAATSNAERGHGHRDHRLRARPRPRQHPPHPVRQPIQLPIRQPPPPHTTATASGRAATWASNNPLPGRRGTGLAVSFQPLTSCRRSTRLQHLHPAHRPPGSAAAAASTRTSRAANIPRRLRRIKQIRRDRHRPRSAPPPACCPSRRTPRPRRYPGRTSPTP